MIDVFSTLQEWALRSTVYEQTNRLKFSMLALGLSERLNWVLKKTSRCRFSVSLWGANI